MAAGQFWIANLRENDQTLLGTSFITLKRHVHELDMLTDEEELELTLVRNSLIKAIRKSFNPITFNYSCLKNDAFKVDPDNTPPDAAHVHFHLKPRYNSKPVVINGTSFLDPVPGRYLANFERHAPNLDVAIKIAQIIRHNLTAGA